MVQDFVELERLPYNRDYKGILGNIMSIGRLGRPRYRCRLVRMPEAEAQKFSLVPSKAALPGSQELLWEAAVSLHTFPYNANSLKMSQSWSQHCAFT